MYLQIVEILLGLLVAVTALVTIAGKLAIPYPILLNVQRKHKYRSRLDDSGNIFTERIAVYQRLQRELLAAKRKTLIALRDSGIINDEVLRKIQYDIDMEEVRLPA